MVNESLIGTKGNDGKVQKFERYRKEAFGA